MFGLPKVWTIIGGGLAALALIAGIFFYARSVGKDSVYLEWEQAKTEQLEEELAEQKRITEELLKFNERAEEVSQKVSTEVTDRTRTITEVKYVNRDVIQEVFQETPFLSKGWVYAHDAISKGESVDPLKASNREPSTFTEADSLRVIQNNYATALTSEAQVNGWIEFYDGIRDANNSVQPTQRNNNPSGPPAP